MGVQGRTYTSNIAKLLKHMDKLQLIQDNKPPSPVMIHILPYNPCNLTCSFCCFANRAMKESLSLEQVKKVLLSFRKLGTTGVEFSGGGEPTLHPQFDDMIRYAHELGYKIGVCTNGTTLKKVKTWDLFTWVRLGMYGFDEGYEYDLSVLRGYPVEISAAYVWDMALETSQNPNITGVWVDNKNRRISPNTQKLENFYTMLSWVEDNRIPTRIAFNAIKSTDNVQQDIETIRGQLATWEHDNNRPLQYAFLSDFNYKGQRRNDHCYMHMIKPCITAKGDVLVCPSSELAPENNYMANEEFKVCDIDGIEEYYSKPPKMRHHRCSFCKYAMANELIDDITTETHHNEFA